MIMIFTGSLTVEEVFKDRDQFASLVREVKGISFRFWTSISGSLNVRAVSKALLTLF